MLQWVKTVLLLLFIIINFIIGSGSLAAMAVFESRYTPNMEVRT